jgi:hypothetical protein
MRDLLRLRGAATVRASRYALVVVAAAFGLVTATGAAASPVPMNCPQQGFCKWGYNYVGPSVNELVYGPSNYWFDMYVDKTSGGTIYRAFGPNGNCYAAMSGASSWYGHPSDMGCGGYVNPFVQYVSGNTSYLYFDDYT